MSASDTTFSMETYKNKCIDVENVRDIVDESRHPSWADYVSKSETYKNTKFEDIKSLFNITQKLVVEHSEEILNVKCLEYSSPSYARSALARDQAVKWDVSTLILFYVSDR